MFRDKKLRVIFIAEIVIPYMIFVFGIPAIYCYANENWEMLDICYPIAMITGLVVFVMEFVIGIIGIVELIRNLSVKNKDKSCILGNLVIGFCSVIFMAQTLLFVLCVQLFTYAQSV